MRCCPGFHFCSLQSTFLYQRDYNVGVKTSSPQKLAFSMPNQVNDWKLFSAVSPHCQFSEGDLLSQQQAGLFRDVSRIPPVNSSTGCKPLFHYWKPWLATKVMQFRFPKSYTTRNSHYCHLNGVKEVFTVLGFHSTFPQYLPIPPVSHCILLPSLPYLIAPTLVPPILQENLFSVSSPGRSMLPPIALLFMQPHYVCLQLAYNLCNS